MSWVDLPPGTGFGIANLPYGSFTPRSGGRRLGVAVGEWVLDVGAAARDVDAPFAPLLSAPVLNPLLAAGRATWTGLRAAVTSWLTDPRHEQRVRAHLFPLSEATLHLPFEPGDYVDFYASEQHATNVGRILRPGTEPLTPNWRHLPIGYHGRSGSIVVSGTPITRPSGQRKGKDDPAPVFGPSIRLDIEAEVGFVVGGPAAGRVPVSGFADRVFGVLLLNDWSARDIQAWEYVPLGPFLGKSFATSVSPWVVPLDALQAARIPPPARDPEPLGYLRDAGDWGLDIDLVVRLRGQVVSRPPFRAMYWTAAQQLAHMTVNGAPARPGDLFASGTVSGPERAQWGSLLEITWNGRDPVDAGGEPRAFLEDGDSVSITATAPATDGGVVDFGEVTGTIVAAAVFDGAPGAG